MTTTESPSDYRILGLFFDALFPASGGLSIVFVDDTVCLVVSAFFILFSSEAVPWATLTTLSNDGGDLRDLFSLCASLSDIGTVSPWS